MTLGRALFSVVAGAFLAAQAVAQAPKSAQLPAYEPGQTFIFDNGRVERVVSAKGGNVTWAARSGRTYSRSSNPIVPILQWSYQGQSGVRTIIGNPNSLWPLKSGGSVSFRAVNETRDDKSKKTKRSVHLWTCRTGPSEKVATPAGTFDAFALICDRFSPNSMRVLDRITWRFAPDVGHYVSRESRDMRTGESELVKLYTALPPNQANSVRIDYLAEKARSLSKPSRAGDKKKA